VPGGGHVDTDLHHQDLSGDVSDSRHRRYTGGVRSDRRRQFSRGGIQLLECRLERSNEVE